MGQTLNSQKTTPRWASQASYVLSNQYLGEKFWESCWFMFYVNLPSDKLQFKKGKEQISISIFADELTKEQCWYFNILCMH